eukprot:gene11006-18970_t
MSGASGSTAPGSAKKRENTCDECGLVEGGDKKLKWCQRCHSASYCGAECQKADWPRHKPMCKYYQLSLKESQEAYGDEGARRLNRQSKWLNCVAVPLKFLMITLLENKRDTHIVVLTTERLEKRPYFKVQHYKVIPLDAIAVELPELQTPMVRDALHTLKMNNQQANDAYGFIVITCSDDSMLPDICMPLESCNIPFFPGEGILREINGEN